MSADFFSAFDAYCEEHEITQEETGAAFAAFLHLATGWDGPADQVKDNEYE